ncbi:hypothetical protein [Paraferrimonas sedimenticola]|uniref:Uncharacterized protein n=1 Tax=Paraferrimonas sedimenticola TaxID=375674 RepID=A0AA37RWQ7_9GAMM|nr:hypothetical protein [Paraferrimonas sedimenticola]GLP96563.1 hypothetical protein GCM10007895_18690 [Paraferrimonas sedimenticola]
MRKLLWVAIALGSAIGLYLYSLSPHEKTFSIEPASPQPQAAIVQSGAPASTNLDATSNTVSVGKPKEGFQPQCIANDWLRNSTEEMIKQYEQAIERHLHSLANEGSDLSQYQHALYAPVESKQERLARLVKYNKSFGGKPLTFQAALNICTTAPEEPGCSIELAMAAIEADPDNGSMWLSAILYFAATKNTEKMRWAMSKAISTNYFNERMGAFALGYAEALQGSAANSQALNLFNGFAEALESVRSFAPLVDTCKEQIADPVFAQQCLQYGQDLQSRAQTSITQIVGIRLQKQVYRHNSDFKSAKIVDESYTRFTPTPPYPTKADILMFSDDEFTRAWLINFDQVGEVEAQRVIHTIAEQLYPGELPAPCEELEFEL